MAGYNWKKGMSNNAVEAYKEGKMPISKWTKKALLDSLEKLYAEESFPCPLDVLKKKKKEELTQLLKCCEWHHSSKFFNCTNFYEISISKLRKLDSTASQIAIEHPKTISENRQYTIVLICVKNWKHEYQTDDSYHSGILYTGWIYGLNNKFKKDAKRIVWLKSFKTINDLNLYIENHVHSKKIENDNDFLLRKIEELKNKFPDIINGYKVRNDSFISLETIKEYFFKENLDYEDLPRQYYLKNFIPKSADDFDMIVQVKKEIISFVEDLINKNKGLFTYIYNTYNYKLHNKDKKYLYFIPENNSLETDLDSVQQENDTRQKIPLLTCYEIKSRKNKSINKAKNFLIDYFERKRGQEITHAMQSTQEEV